MNEIMDGTASNIEVALCLAGRIASPCEDEKSWNQKRFYMYEAKTFAEKLVEGTAKEILEAVLRKYSN